MIVGGDGARVVSEDDGKGTAVNWCRTRFHVLLRQRI